VQKKQKEKIGGELHDEEMLLGASFFVLFGEKERRRGTGLSGVQ
jgi:hypothetical protein